MRAARLVEPGRMVVEHTPEPAPGPGQVRIQVEGCGVCASNLGPWKGLPWLTYPLKPGDMGHEAWGRIDAVGPGVTGLREGQRVAALSYAAYAEKDVADATNVVPLPDSLDEKPFPGEALACAMNIYRRSRIEPGQTVAIVGIGWLGALLTQLASGDGARVLAISRRSFALEIAAAAGAAETIPMDDHHRVIERVKGLTEGAMCERVIECAGAQWPLDLAGELCGTRATLVIAGYHQDGPRQVNVQMWNWKGLDVVNAHERDPAVYVDGMKRAITAIAEGRLDPFPLLTHTFPLERLGEALDATDRRPDGFLKAVVKP